MKKIKKHPVLRVRKSSMTDRQRLSTMKHTDKKKEQSKKACRKKTEE
jgi:hypothetical protein